MALEEIIEYVIVRDLVLKEEPNHTKKFWYKVREILPAYKERRKWLKENSPKWRCREKMFYEKCKNQSNLALLSS